MSPVSERFPDNASLLAWLCTNGINVVTHFSVDKDIGRTNVSFSATSVSPEQFRAGLEELVTTMLGSYQEHIDADHEALREVWKLHTVSPPRDYCPEDGFGEPCRTKRTITGELDRD